MAATAVRGSTAHRTRALAADLQPTTAPAAALLARRTLESNLGALTTTFSPPSDCSTLLLRTLIESAEDDRDQWYFDYGLTCTVGDDGDATTFLPESCYPGALAEWYNGNADDNILDRADLAAFSPGSVCPAGYEVACSFTRTTGGTHSEPKSATTTDAYDLWNMLEDGETAVGCCPENYNCHKESYRWCESTYTANKPVTAVAYDSRCETSTFETEAAVMWAALMDAQVATAPRVLLVLPTDTDENDDDADASTGTESRTAASGEASSGSEAGSGGGGGGLSTGAKVAIGVVVPVVVMLAVALLWFFIHRRKKRPIAGVDAPAQDSSPPPPVASSEDCVVTKAELPASKGVVVEKPELDGSHPHRAMSTEVGEVHEMPANSIDSAVLGAGHGDGGGEHGSPPELPDKQTTPDNERPDATK